MADVSGVTKHFITGQEGFTTTLASTISSGATTVPLNSVSGYTNGEQVAFIIEPTDASKKQVFTGTIDTSGVQVTGVEWTEGTNQTHNAGVTVVDYWTATHQAALVKGLKISHDDDGTLKAGAVDVTAVLADSVVTSAKILDGTIAEGDLANGYMHGSDGYIDATDTWTYASASTFTISGVDRTAMFPVGTKIRLTQTTDKYFYVTGSSFSTNTTVTVNGGSDYSLANASITSPRYSYMQTPQGFPQFFNFAGGATGFSSLTTEVYTLRMDGNQVTLNCSISGTSNATTFAMTAPITSRNISGAFWQSAIGLGTNNSANLTTTGRVYLGANSTAITLGTASNSDVWTGSNTKAAYFTLVYQV